MKYNTPRNRIFWIDVETMKQMDEKDNYILELVIIITNRKMDIIHDPVRILFRYDEEIYENHLSDWAKENLHDLIKESKSNGIHIDQGEKLLLNIMRWYLGLKDDQNVNTLRKKHLIRFWGSSTWYDRQIICNTFPSLQKYIHHQTFDITSLLILVKMYNRNYLCLQPINDSNHSAYHDLISSINLTKFYVDSLIKFNYI